MGWVTDLAIYFVIWWTVLFAVLPIGVRSQVEADNVAFGTAESAPERPRMLWKLGVTTLVSAAVFALFWFVTEGLGFGVEDLPHIVPGT